jgi:hypothetical protein
MSPGYCVADLVSACQSSDCTTWYGCVGGCPDPECFRQCDGDHPGAATEYQPFYDCVCTTLPPTDTVQLMFGMAHCVDVCAGLMDACGA